MTRGSGAAGEDRARRIARIALALFYGLAGIAHLTVTAAMVRITPGWVPFPHAVVIGTGLCELAGAAALMTQAWRRAAALALALYAVCVFPANVKHAVHDLGGGVGLGWWYHAPRLLAQPLIVWWALWVAGVGSRRR